MIAQSNNPLPNTPQRWKDGQFIYYYNHVDNGIQESDDPMLSKEGERYMADFTILQSTDDPEIERAITRAMIDPDLNQAVIDNIEVEAKPAIQVVREYKSDALITSKISEILRVAEIMPVEEKPVEIIKKK